jgi:DnaJ-domain-containing protein 1
MVIPGPMLGVAAGLLTRVAIKANNARIERQRARRRRATLALVRGNLQIIERSIRGAAGKGDSLWLSALLILRQESSLAYERFQSGALSYRRATAKLRDLRGQAEVLSRPPPDETNGEAAERPNHYEVLGIVRNASQEQIRSIHRKLVQIYHPDKGGLFGVDGDKRFRQIQDAYATLGDAEKRAQYDNEIGDPQR